MEMEQVHTTETRENQAKIVKEMDWKALETEEAWSKKHKHTHREPEKEKERKAHSVENLLLRLYFSFLSFHYV